MHFTVGQLRRIFLLQLDELLAYQLAGCWRGRSKAHTSTGTNTPVAALWLVNNCLMVATREFGSGPHGPPARPGHLVIDLAPVPGPFCLHSVPATIIKVRLAWAGAKQRNAKRSRSWRAAPAMMPSFQQQRNMPDQT
jgi:hypothetical protein